MLIVQFFHWKLKRLQLCLITGAALETELLTWLMDSGYLSRFRDKRDAITVQANNIHTDSCFYRPVTSLCNLFLHRLLFSISEIRNFVNDLKTKDSGLFYTLNKTICSVCLKYEPMLFFWKSILCFIIQIKDFCKLSEGTNKSHKHLKKS